MTPPSQKNQTGAEQRVVPMLTHLDHHLQQHGGAYLLDQQISIADFYLFMLGRWSRGMQNQRDYPHPVGSCTECSNAIRSRPCLHKKAYKRRTSDGKIQKPAIMPLDGWLNSGLSLANETSQLLDVRFNFLINR